MPVASPTAAASAPPAGRPVDVVVAGAAGRMGTRVVACLQGAPDLRLVGALEAPAHPALGRDAGELAGVGRVSVAVGGDPATVVTPDRVLVEFSVPEASLEHLRLVARNGARAVIGTTGFTAAQRAEIVDLAKRAAILVSPNMSVAVNVAFSLLGTMAKALGDEYDVEITETHHRFKKDAPSGTALRMAEIVAAALGRDLDRVLVCGRQGLPGERTRSEIALLSPVLPSKIVGIGLNYRDRATELRRAIPAEPVMLLKPTTTLIGPDDPIVYPSISARVEHEAELAVVIKRRCRDVPVARAREFILGYTCLNDVTARDLQEKDGRGTRAKAFDTFCPIGPCVTTDIDPSALAIEAYVNGEVRQSSSTKEMVFPIEDLVARVSQVMTLLPGDVITTGTPAGVGPLRPGDRVEVRIESIGILKNPVVKL